MSAPTSLKLRIAELEWAGQAALGILPGQMTRDELLAVLSKSETLQSRHGNTLAARQSLRKLGRVELEQLYREVDRDEPLSSPASGRMRGLEWADGTVMRKDRPFQVVPGEDGLSRFRHIPYGYFLPAVMTNAAMSAQKRGEPTVLEGFLLTFAWVEWLIASRNMLWAPSSPKPSLLAVLVEAFGITGELHRDHPERLMRLAARLPTWYPHRGTIERAMQLLEETVGEDLTIKAVQAHSSENDRAAIPISEEAFSCRSAAWWQRRRTGDSSHVPSERGGEPMRIDGGLLRFQPSSGDGFELAREDVLIGWRADSPFPTVLSRVLPIWVSLRIVALNG
ncbi:MAG: hypothetical protein ACI8S6_002116 [Myxococcota bacterium]|jgi:hypothetical protein